MRNCESSVLHACLERYRIAIKDDSDDEEQEDKYEDENAETRILLKKIKDLKLLDPLFKFLRSIVGALFIFMILTFFKASIFPFNFFKRD